MPDLSRTPSSNTLDKLVDIYNQAEDRPLKFKGSSQDRTVRALKSAQSEIKKNKELKNQAVYKEISTRSCKTTNAVRQFLGNKLTKLLTMEAAKIIKNPDQGEELKRLLSSIHDKKILEDIKNSPEFNPADKTIAYHDVMDDLIFNAQLDQLNPLNTPTSQEVYKASVQYKTTPEETRDTGTNHKNKKNKNNKRRQEVDEKPHKKNKKSTNNNPKKSGIGSRLFGKKSLQKSTSLPNLALSSQQEASKLSSTLSRSTPSLNVHNPETQSLSGQEEVERIALADIKRSQPETPPPIPKKNRSAANPTPDATQTPPPIPRRKPRPLTDQTRRLSTTLPDLNTQVPAPKPELKPRLNRSPIDNADKMAGVGNHLSLNHEPSLSVKAQKDLANTYGVRTIPIKIKGKEIGYMLTTRKAKEKPSQTLLFSSHASGRVNRDKFTNPGYENILFASPRNKVLQSRTLVFAEKLAQGHTRFSDDSQVYAQQQRVTDYAIEGGINTLPEDAAKQLRGMKRQKSGKVVNDFDYLLLDRNAKGLHFSDLLIAMKEAGLHYENMVCHMCRPQDKDATSFDVFNTFEDEALSLNTFSPFPDDAPEAHKSRRLPTAADIQSKWGRGQYSNLEALSRDIQQINSPNELDKLKSLVQNYLKQQPQHKTTYSEILGDIQHQQTLIRVR